MRHAAVLSTVLAATTLLAADPPRFRTDADGPVLASKSKGPKRKAKDPNAPPEWFQLVDGKFPPAGSAPLEGKVHGMTLSCDQDARNSGHAATASGRPPQRMPFWLRMRAHRGVERPRPRRWRALVSRRRR